ncbi:MAG: tetratricopeptide repeat protein [Sphingobium sp.]
MRDIAETIMRFTPATLAMAAVLTMVSSVGISQRPDSQISPLSLEWATKGNAARTRGDLAGANDAYETALAVDPRNRGAFIALGDIARQQDLQGKAVRYYKGALALDPADMTALAGTVNALVERGALANARETLSRMKTLCRTDCGTIAKLDTLIENKAIAQAQTAPPVPETGTAPQQP